MALIDLRIVHQHRSRRNPRVMNVELVKPEQEEVCPISQGPMHLAELECLPSDAVFRPDTPELTGMKLPCGHAFNAMNILYHFVRNRTTACPVCRAGPKGAHLSVCAVPKHIRARMNRRARGERRRDQEQEVDENLHAAIAVQIIDYMGMRMWIAHYVRLGTCSLHLRYEEGDSHLRFPLSTHFFDNSSVMFSVLCVPFRPRGAFRLLGAAGDIVFPGSVVGPSVFHNTWTAMSVPGATTSYSVTAEDQQIIRILWCIPVDFFFIMAQQL